MAPRNEAQQWLDEMGIIIPVPDPAHASFQLEQQLDEFGIVVSTRPEPSNGRSAGNSEISSEKVDRASRRAAGD